VTRLVPTLAALALVGVGMSSASAVDVGDSTTKISFGLQLQERAEVSKATADNDTYNRVTGAHASVANTPYDVTNGLNQYPDAVDFYVRRARFFVKGDYQELWHFNLGFRADRADQNGPAAAGRTFVIQQAYVSRDLPMNDDYKSTVKFGLDYAFFCRADMGPSSAFLLPNQRATHSLSAQRGTGVSYMLNAPFLTWGVDVQNNNTDDTDNGGTAAVPPQTHYGEGLWYSTRVELTPTKDMGWNIGKWQEDYAGAPGHGVALGLEVGRNDRNVLGTFTEAATGDINGNGTLDTFSIGTAGVTGIRQDITVFGSDLLFHYDGLSALAEVREQQDKYKVHSTAGDFSGTQKHLIWLVQAGYAIQTGDKQAFEPAARYTHIDQNVDNKNEYTSFNNTQLGAQTGYQDYGASGNQIEVGVNYYFNLNNNKTGLVFTHWKAEKGDGKADIIRLQHQLNF
jgi:hypothetical protein